MKNLHLFGDSTCAIKQDSARPETGWGEMIGKYLPMGWAVYNNAVNGMSTKSCLDSGNFYRGLDRINLLDYAIIQFGHNDNKSDPKRGTDPWGSYQANLRTMVLALRERGARVILLSPIARRRFSDGLLYNTHGEYPAAMESVAEEFNLPYVDMNLLTMKYFNELGEEATRKYFMFFDAGIYPNYPEGRDDNTHLRPEGAELIARMIYDNIKGYLL